jgi:hypothetical protein
MARLRVLLGFGIAATLAACSNAPPPPLRLPDMSFAQGAPVQFNVARIEIENDYKAPAARPHIEYDMPVSPENAVRNWVRDRLKATGRNGVMRVVIKNASATETPLATDEGLTGMFKKEQSARIDMALDVSIQMLDERQFVVAEVSGKASRSRTEPEGQKLNERDRLLYDLTYDLVKGFNDEVTPNLPDAFQKWMGMN